MQPFALILGSQNIIAITTSIIFILLIVIFQFQIKKYVVITLVISTLLFLINYFLFDNQEIVLLIFIEFLLKCFSLYMIASFQFSPTYLKKYFYFFSFINFLILSGVVLFGLIEDMEYMRFGYAMLPTTLISLYAMRENKKLLNAFIGTSSFILILIFGSRGPILGMLIFFLILLFIDKKLKIYHRILSIFLLIIGYVYLFTFDGLIKILNFIYYDLNLQTYSINKLRAMIIDGFAESSSGRDYLYNQFFNQIMNSPLFGSGIGISHRLWEVTPHNLFLQILLEFGFVGIVGFIVIALFMIYQLVLIRKAENELFLLLCIIFSVSFGRLLVSSDIWIRQELWLFISLTINAMYMIRDSK